MEYVKYIMKWIYVNCNFLLYGIIDKGSIALVILPSQVILSVADNLITEVRSVESFT